jgi:DNA (cytosine-5)-methyltransferase 1
MLRAIREIQPTYVVGENVLGLVNWNRGLVFDEVQADLEAEGYEVQPFILPACAVNAPHRRDRVWFVAYNSNARIKSLQFRRENGICKIKSTANPDCNGQHECDCKHEVNASEGGQYAQRDVSKVGEYNSNPFIQGLQRSKDSGKAKRKGQNRTKQLAGLFRTAWENFPTQSPICNGDDGISTRLDGITFSKWRNESIKGGGNAIVPQVVFQIFKVIEEIDLQ